MFAIAQQRKTIACVRRAKCLNCARRARCLNPLRGIEHQVGMKLLGLLIAACLPSLASAAEIIRPKVEPAAYAEGSVDHGDPRVEVRLLADLDEAAPGDTVRVGVLFHIDPEWHIYWRNSGESGMATEISLAAPGWKSDPLLWPAPHVFVDKSGQLATFGYSDAELIWMPVHVPEDAADTARIKVDVSWLSCKVECVPGWAMLSIPLSIGTRKPSDQAGIFDDAEARLPTPAHNANFSSSVATVHRSQSFHATLDVGAEVIGDGVERFTFIPDETPGISWSTSSHDGPKITLVGTASPDKFKAPCVLSGVVWTSEGAVAVNFPVTCTNDSPTNETAPKPPIEPTSPPKPPPAIYFLLLAFFGGMLLNLMPCVFPVLALKAFALVKNAQAGRAESLRHAAAYTTGVVASMLGLAGFVIGLRYAGTEVGWGFQFQEPWFLIALAALLTLFAVNLFGAFEITMSTSMRPTSTGLRRSAAEGALAVILATPCSAPLLGTAVGFALASSTAMIIAIFVLLGLGLSFPFVLLSAFPGWAKKLPKPGPWMDTFKRLLGFTLLAATIWIQWLIAQTLGSEISTRVWIFLLGLSMAAWVFGLAQFTNRRKIGIVLALGIVALSVASLPNLVPGQKQATHAQPGGLWQPWSPGRVAAETANGKTVFVDFTADWCITCKVNENGVLADPEIHALLNREDIVALKADWTMRDDRIRAELQKYGKAGVPMYLVVHPGAHGVVLPELLTKSMIIESLKQP